MSPVESGANALIAFKCCVENNRRAEFLDWRICRAVASAQKWDAPVVGRTRGAFANAADLK